MAKCFNKKHEYKYIYQLICREVVRCQKIQILLCLLLVAHYSRAQLYKPLGHHFITNYTAKQYKLNPQSFDIEQDNRGVMYFANDGGVLEFDGETWRTIKIPTQRTYALEKSRSGKIYVGALDNFGILVSDKRGEFIYESISSKIKNEKVPTIRQIYCAGDWIYFIPDKAITDEILYAYNEKTEKIFIVSSPGKIIFSGIVGNIPLIQVEGKGLYQIQQRNLVSVPYSEKWANVSLTNSFDMNERYYFFDGNILYSTDKNFKDFKPDFTQNILPESGNFQVLKNKFIFTNKNGIQIHDMLGNLLFAFSKNVNLVDNNVRQLFLDKDNNLWAATENGISIIDIANTLTYFNYFDGIDGVVEYMGMKNNNMIVETHSGVFEMKAKVSLTENICFDKYSSITNAPYGITDFVQNNDTSLIIADFEGILKQVKGNQFERIFKCAPWNVIRYKKNQNILLVPDYTEGLILLVFENNAFKPIRIPELSGKSGRSVYEDKDGILWLSEETNGLYRIELSKDQYNNFIFKINYSNQQSGLPEGFSFAFEFNNQLYFGTEHGFFEIKDGKFVQSKNLTLDFAKKYSIHRAKIDPSGNLWVSAYDVNDIKHYYFGYGKFVNGKMKWIHRPFLKISEEKIDCIYHESETSTWLGGPEGLFRFDKKDAEDFNRKYELLLRKFRIGDDSLIYGGHGNINNAEWSFNFAKQHYYFEFSATYYKTENGVRYSYFLEGFDKSWSKYTSNNYVEFTNLYEGDYTLKVKAIDDYGNVSKPYQLSFTISPPWFRTITAFVGYGIIFILIILGAVRISSNGLKKIIAQRTKEIEEQKLVVEEKNREIIDSISYAKRLQQAILPALKNIHEVFPQSFVLYKPKDIIAGDFYWMERVDDLILFAVCDCTGHGVPGAMVSVVGANSLNRCVKEFGLREPSKILDKLTELVEETFSHSDKEVRDGMDVSLCAINFKKMEMQWSGANNPLWMIKKIDSNNEYETELSKYSSTQTFELNHNKFLFGEIKADKQPIGKFENRKPFTNHVLPLQKGDLIYLFSDGYADQFGGDKGKKFKYSQLKEIILSQINSTITSQENYFANAFENWRGELEQTDDVCLWTVKV